MYQDVTRDKRLSAAAKGLYAYLAAFSGVSDECYPSVETITSEMSIGKDTFYRHINALVAAGVVQKCQVVGPDGKFGRTLYRLTHKVNISSKSDFPFPQNGDTETPDTEGGETINNRIKKEQSLRTNNINYQAVVDLYNAICMSFPKLTKLSDKRRKTIRARLNQGYTVEDFKRLFELAEGSSFLKGGNSRNWMANFDWLISDANMAKTLDGNYADRQKEKGGVTDGTQSGSSFKL